MFDSTLNVLMILLGFGLVIFIHELGHFLAARWAGVRVHAFAVGFGPALLSFRKGMGVRVGSSEIEYMTRVAQAGGTTPTAADASATNERFASGTLRGISPTEYRLNALPFGGYVKMLGQEDANPNATSSAPDSYAVKPVWKRMVIVSAGVVMNVILAAVLFVVVFMAGMREVAPVIGFVVPGSPADAAGLKAGDTVRRINDDAAVTFTDLQIATAMASPGESVRLRVDRAGQGVDLEVKPVVGGAARMMQIGVGPETSLTLASRPARPSERREAQEVMEKIGWGKVPMGSRLSAISGVEIPASDSETIDPLRKAVAESGGSPLSLTFTTAKGETTQATLTPEAKMSVSTTTLPDGTPMSSSHVLGLFPLLRATNLTPAARSAGLVEGDVFVKVDGLEYPDIGAAVGAIRAKKGSTVNLTVRRGETDVELNVPVSSEGRIGFSVGEDLESTRVAAMLSGWQDGNGWNVLAVEGMKPGSRIDSINGKPVSTFADINRVLKDELSAAYAVWAGPHEPPEGIPTLAIEFATSQPGAQAQRETLRVFAHDKQIAAVRSIPWSIPLQAEAVFTPVRTTVKAADPWHALGMGVAKTKRVLVMTYLTFARLFQGTVKVEHLKGPVGITDLGSRFAEEGFIYVLFFLGLISANLAVVNFLPLPIVDGGLFLMLCYEGLARRPVPLKVQNAVTIAGLALIGTMFLVVTFNDVMNLVR